MTQPREIIVLFLHPSGLLYGFKVLIGLGRFFDNTDEVEDGLVYGAACGLGFGATENVLYGLSEEAVSVGYLGILAVVILRTVSSILLLFSFSRPVNPSLNFSILTCTYPYVNL